MCNQGVKPERPHLISLQMSFPSPKFWALRVEGFGPWRVHSCQKTNSKSPTELTVLTPERYFGLREPSSTKEESSQHTVLLYLHGICSYIFFFIPDIGNLCSFFPLISLAMGLSGFFVFSKVNFNLSLKCISGNQHSFIDCCYLN